MHKGEPPPAVATYKPSMIFSNESYAIIAADFTEDYSNARKFHSKELMMPEPGEKLSRARAARERYKVENAAV